MPPKKPSKTTQPAVSKGTKEKSAAPTGAPKPEPSAKAATMPPPVPSGKPDGSPAKSQTREDASPPDSLAQPPSSMRAAGPAEASAVDGPPSHSGIDALAVMKQAEVDKRAAKSGPCPEAKHISAAQAIAKSVIRDHGDRVKPPEKRPATEKAPVHEPAKEKTRLPAEPKGPIAGVGAEGIPPPVVATQDVEGLLDADHPDPFAFLGMHVAPPGDTLTVRVFLPEANRVEVLDLTDGKPVTQLDRVHDEGMFVGAVPGRKEPFPYRLRITTPDGKKDIEDPYRFPPLLTDADARKLRESDHVTSYQVLGAHPNEIQGVAGVSFAVWAPNAYHVSVVGDFNGWDGRRHGMRLRHECGVWEIFLPGAREGDLYKYEIKSRPGTSPLVKSDPYAFGVETQPGTASVVRAIGKYRWGDGSWMKQQREKQGTDAPLSFYEVHLSSWRRKVEEDNRWLSYRELADELVEYVSDLGFTHIALLPISEHSFDDTVGYLPSALFAPTSRYGTPDDFRYLVDSCHRAGIGVVVDWVPNFLSSEPEGLTLFDGTTLYEDTNPYHSRDPDWDMPLYDLGKPAVVNYLLSNASYWLDQFHLDGLRIDSLAKLLYLDYGRGEGQWVPNKDGGNENLEALDFVRRLNRLVHEKHPGVLMIAEDSSLRQGVTKKVQDGGLGFDLRWNSAWAYDTLRYLRRHPVHRKYYHYELISPLGFAFDESFVLPVSHDHVSIGQGSMINKIPGDRWQKFATLRAWLGLMYTLPGKKLMFMGTEFMQDREWNSTISLDWHLLEDPMHLGAERLIRDFNKLMSETPALHELDADTKGFEWIDTNDEDSSVIAFARYGKDRSKVLVAVTHFTPVVRPNYRIGVPQMGYYKEILNTDAEVYGGGNWGSEGGATAEHHGAHGRDHSICLTLPPYATVVLALQRDQS